MPIAIDASVALAWAMPDERGETALSLLTRVQEVGLCVPSHFRAEVANGLWSGEPRRITPAQVAEFVSRLDELTIDVDYQGGEAVFDRVLPLARAHGLTIYDALYLELSERRGLELATFDGDLRDAAHSVGVKVLP